MAIYFGADHFVWAYQIGLVNDKKTGERFQKVRTAWLRASSNQLLPMILPWALLQQLYASI